jgi:hypothetical protein
MQLNNLSGGGGGNGDLSKWRKAYVGNSTDEGRYLKDLINKNKAYSDSYIDSIVARIHLKNWW